MATKRAMTKACPKSNASIPVTYLRARTPPSTQARNAWWDGFCQPRGPFARAKPIGGSAIRPILSNPKS
ncbi:unnamed protein product [Prunus armeniaca]|uniref:Uncharacterized protein n=1 Tax=Prunus armeniaca TaxID=36596 RepID=A0A6J5VUY4_PRUAR|nr:unnamed protein product [Prunus armeniaca]CAB4320037.1 unnamed protein product [Prunus armeniaca]